MEVSIKGIMRKSGVRKNSAGEDVDYAMFLLFIGNASRYSYGRNSNNDYTIPIYDSNTNDNEFFNFLEGIDRTERENNANLEDLDMTALRAKVKENMDKAVAEHDDAQADYWAHFFAMGTDKFCHKTGKPEHGCVRVLSKNMWIDGEPDDGRQHRKFQLTRDGQAVTRKGKQIIEDRRIVYWREEFSVIDNEWHPFMGETSEEAAELAIANDRETFYEEVEGGENGLIAGLANLFGNEKKEEAPTTETEQLAEVKTEAPAEAPTTT